MQTTKTTDWEVITETGRAAAERLDEGRWIIGDLALLVETNYGADNIGRFGREINVGKRRINEYRQCAGFFEKCARRAFLEENPTITYSHMRCAMRLKSPERAYKLLNKAARHNWTVDQVERFMARYRRLLNPVIPEPPETDTTTPRFECEAVVGEVGDDELTRDYVTFRAPELTAHLKPGQSVRIVVYINE